ncbi:PaaI family thioesterase [Rhabdothermincola salaria]|uniref:PaaI family thioesterase n=1 Tax=Rhabdothermincola salaria TaxID=2903142 RepID=UPI001E34A5E1|nr:PaaI family thioesterase [Rhabdothermincola salaria]MCD9622892.1 PaaI family thioesterase [Rhabdothermincola salaria]
MTSGERRDAGSATGQVGEHEATAGAAQAVRSLIEGLRVADAPAEVLEQVAGLAAEAAALLAPHRVEAMRMQGALYPEVMLGGGGPAGRDPAGFFPYSPVVGPLNPLSPPIVLTSDGERTTGTAVLGAPYVGPPDMVHGGNIALIFDELLGVTNVINGLGAFTGTLSVRYERPTPLGTELELEGWIDRVEGRKVFTVGTISHAGQVTARGEGIFIRTELSALDV